MSKLLKVKDIKFGTKIIVYGTHYVKAGQIASCYGLTHYPHLILVNKGEEYKLRGLNTRNCVELYIMKNYPNYGKIIK